MPPNAAMTMPAATLPNTTLPNTTLTDMDRILLRTALKAAQRNGVRCVGLRLDTLERLLDHLGALEANRTTRGAQLSSSAPRPSR